MVSIPTKAAQCTRPVASVLRRPFQQPSTRRQLSRSAPLKSAARSLNSHYIFECNGTLSTKPAAGCQKSNSYPMRWIHAAPISRRGESQPLADESNIPITDLEKYDVFGDLPVPSHSVDVCTYNGFQLNNGATITDGSGVLLVGGEAFVWRPWLAEGNKGDMKLLNSKGQWDVPNRAFSLLDLIWPRPDLLVLGLGPDMRPLSPALRKHISSLGMRVEILDTRNAASQFNLLVRERGITDVAAALIPIGWKERVGANY